MSVETWKLGKKSDNKMTESSSVAAMNAERRNLIDELPRIVAKKTDESTSVETWKRDGRNVVMPSDESMNAVTR